MSNHRRHLRIRRRPPSRGAKDLRSEIGQHSASGIREALAGLRGRPRSAATLPPRSTFRVAAASSHESGYVIAWQFLSCRALRVLLLLLLLTVAWHANAVGAAEAPVEAGRQALQGGSFPWYDGQQDAVRPVDVAPPSEPFPGRRSDWSRQQEQEQDPQTKASNPINRGLQTLVWIFATLLLCAIFGLLLWGFLKRPREQTVESTSRPRPARRADRVEELPVPIDVVEGDLLEQALAHRRAGDIRQAMICLFSYQLIQLDNRQLIHLERGKTNRQYLREIQHLPQTRDLLRRTMVSFEDVFFGNHPLPIERLDACLEAVDDFQSGIEQAASA